MEVGMKPQMSTVRDTSGRTISSLSKRDYRFLLILTCESDDARRMRFRSSLLRVSCLASCVIIEDFVSESNVSTSTQSAQSQYTHRCRETDLSKGTCWIITVLRYSSDAWFHALMHRSKTMCSSWLEGRATHYGCQKKRDRFFFLFDSAREINDSRHFPPYPLECVLHVDRCFDWTAHIILSFVRETKGNLDVLYSLVKSSNLLIYCLCVWEAIARRGKQSINHCDQVIVEHLGNASE